MKLIDLDKPTAGAWAIHIGGYCKRCPNYETAHGWAQYLLRWLARRGIDWRGQGMFLEHESLWQVKRGGQ